jgi:hypothetical protein
MATIVDQPTIAGDCPATIPVGYRKVVIFPLVIAHRSVTHRANRLASLIELLLLDLLLLFLGEGSTWIESNRTVVCTELFSKTLVPLLQSGWSPGKCEFLFSHGIQNSVDCRCQLDLVTKPDLRIPSVVLQEHDHAVNPMDGDFSFVVPCSNDIENLFRRLENVLESGGKHTLVIKRCLFVVEVIESP